MPTVSVTSLIKILGQLRLLKSSQLEELTRTVQATSPEPRAMAKELFRRGWLTAYQIRELFHGRGPDLVLGQYVLLEPLGAGGMGQVFKARHRHLNRLVALKILREERLAKPEASRRFYREIRVAAQLAHPNIVLAYDANRVGKRVFFAMEYVEGIDLYRLVKKAGPLPIALACEFIRQTALGLQHAHERGLVHRDIKPPNLLVTLPSGPRGKSPGRASGPGLPAAVACQQPQPAPPLVSLEGTPLVPKLPFGNERAGDSTAPVVKILDLGLARWKWSAGSDPSSAILTQEGMVIGTVDYIAPEQAQDSRFVDIRADLYSLGCTFYYLLTGRPPFPEGTVIEKLFKHQTEKPPPLARLRPDVPPRLAALVDKLLAKRPEDRYQTPAELAATLTAVMSVAAVSPGARPESGGAPPLVPKLEFGNEGGECPIAAAAILPKSTPSAIPPAEDTVDSAAGWAEIIKTPIEIKPASSQWLRKTLPPRRWLWTLPPRRWLWPAAALGGPLLMGLVLLIFLRERPATGPSAQTKSPHEKLRQVGAGLNAAAIFKVVANMPWQDTGVEVFANRPVTLSAHGDWKKGQASCSADGLAAETRDRTLEPGAPVMCLLARIGDETTPVALGSSKTVLSKRSGHLYMQANTFDLHDCEGSLHVEIRGGKPTAEAAPALGPTRVEAAELLFKPLLAKAAQPGANVEELRRGLLGLCLQYAGTAQAARAAGILGQLPSPLDKLPQVSADERFAWQPKELVAVLGEHRQRHWGPVSCVAFSPDGQRVASGGQDAAIRVWDAATGKEELILKGHSGPVTALVFTPDGETLVSASGVSNQPGEIKLWNLANGEERSTIRGHTNVLLAAGGKAFATKTDDGTVKIWDLAGKERGTLKGHTAAVSSVALAPDGQTAASASADMTVKLWNLATGKERHTLKGHAAAVGFVAFAPDGNTVASASADATVKLWDVVSGQEQATLKGHSAEVTSLAFAPDGKTVASGGLDRTVRLWDRATRQGWASLRGHTAGVTCVAFASDGNTLASGSADRSVRLWDATGGTDKTVAKETPGRERHPLRSNLGAALCVAFAPDGSTLAAGMGDGSVKLWETATGKEAASLPGHTDEVLGVAYAPGGKTLASASRDKTGKLWDLATKKEQVTLSGHGDIVWTVGFAQDGKTVATGSTDRTVKLWDPDKGQLVDTIDEQSLILVPGRASDTRAVSIPGADQTVKLWQSTANQVGFSFAGPSTADLSWVIATDGKTVATRGEERTVKLWDAATQKERVTLPAHGGSVISVALAPDGKTVATVSDDRSVKLWDAYTGQERLTVQGQTGPIWFVAFTPDGSRLLTAGDGGRVMIVWETASGKKLNEWRLPGLVYGIAFAPDSRHLATANSNGTVYILRLGSASPHFHAP